MIKETIAVDSDETSGTWTNPFVPPSNPRFTNQGFFTVSVSGTFSATVTLQRSFDGGDSWLDVATYTDATETQLEDHTIGIQYRAGCKNGEYTSGTVNIVLAK
jgi:hypothetical protein